MYKVSKKYFVGAIVALIIPTFAILFLSCATQPTTNTTKNPQTVELSDSAQLDTSVLVTFIRYGGYSDEICTKKIEYPEFNNHAVLNKAILDYINSNEAEFDQLLDDNRKAYSEAGGTDLQGSFVVNWDKGQMNGQYISIIITIYYYAGGANGITSLKSFNYDVKNERFVTLNDIMPTSQTLEQVSKQVRTELESTYNPANDTTLNVMLSFGTEPTADNYSVFTFDDDVITFWFQKYQVLPGSYGTPSVKVYR